VRILGALSGVLGGAIAVLAILLLNGGYVYRTQCPRADGSTETTWSYKLDLAIPYIGYSRSGCESHTATRVGLDAAGLWKIRKESAPAIQDHSLEYSDSDVSTMTRNCVNTGESRKFCSCVAKEMIRRLSLTEYNQAALAIQGGATTYDELPSSIQQKMHDITYVAEHDCR
jgi:hypothetical protein